MKRFGAINFVSRVALIFSFCATGIKASQAQDSLQFSSEDLKLYPLLFQQTAAEYRALCYQAYNIARMRLDEILEKNPGDKNLAVITDLDETVLDNSDVEAEKNKTGKPVDYQKWIAWLNQPHLPVVPGSVSFLQYAGSKGVHIFYISNRNVKGLELTLSILQKLHLPDADTSHMLFMTDDFSKEPRRQAVMENHQVVMLLGDNLADFSGIFDTGQISGRANAADSVKDEWGSKFIVLPNPVYGDWEAALYDFQDPDSIPLEQKIALLKSLLKGLDVN